MNDSAAPDNHLFGHCPIVLCDKPPAPVNWLNAPAWQGLLLRSFYRPFDSDDASNVVLTSGEITHHPGEIAVFAT